MSYVVIRQQVEGSTEVGFETAYYSDLKFYSTRSAALKAGYRSLGSDDFNVGTVKDGKLIAFGWGDKDFGDDGGEPHGGYDLDQIAEQTFIRGQRWSA